MVCNMYAYVSSCVKLLRRLHCVASRALRIVETGSYGLLILLPLCLAAECEFNHMTN